MVLYTYGWLFLTKDIGEDRRFCTLMVDGSLLKTWGKTDGSVHLW